MPIRLQLGFSHGLFWLLIALHGAALLAVWLSAFPRTGQGVFSVLIGLSALAALRRHVWRRGAGATRAVFWDADGIWRRLDAAGHESLVERRGESLRTPWLVILNLACPDPGGRCGGRRHTVLIARDSCDPRAFRQLRLRLRVAPVADVAVDDDGAGRIA